MKFTRDESLAKLRTILFDFPINCEQFRQATSTEIFSANENGLLKGGHSLPLLNKSTNVQ
jgi:hypothetical protein